MRYFERDGQHLPAHSPADAVNLRGRGWVEVVEAPPASVPAEPPVPELVAPPAVEAVPDLSAPRGRRKPNNAEE